MMTRADWDVMTPQQQWDYTRLLDAILDDAQDSNGVLRGGAYIEDERGILRRKLSDTPPYIVHTLIEAGIDP